MSINQKHATTRLCVLNKGLGGTGRGVRGINKKIITSNINARISKNTRGAIKTSMMLTVFSLKIFNHITNYFLRAKWWVLLLGS